MEPNESTFDERMKRLERKLVVSRLWSSVLTIMVGALGLAYWHLTSIAHHHLSSGHPKQRVVKAAEFEVIDSRGNVLAKFGKTAGTSPLAQLSFSYHPFSKSENLGITNSAQIGSELFINDLGIFFGNYKGITFGSITPNGTMHPPPNGPWYDAKIGQPMALTINAGTVNANDEVSIGNISNHGHVWIDINPNSLEIMQGALTRVALGVVHLNDDKTGDKITTSPSRLTFFDQKGNQIWRVPYP